MKDHYDVVVIGAGNGGLAAATRVLQAGKTCLLCEKHNIPGGFATSFVRGRFEFEASLHELNGIGKKDNHGSTYAMFSDLGVEDKIKWHQIDHAFRLISEKEGIDFTMPIGEENIIKACKNLCPDGDKHIKTFLDVSKNIAGGMSYLSDMKGKPDPKVMQERYMDYLTLASYSVNEAFDILKTPQIIRDVLSAYWSYIGAHFDEMNFAHYCNMTYKYFTMGAVAPSNRSHGMSLAYEDQIHKLGGDLYFNTEVTKILTDKEGKISGVELCDGSIIHTKHIIANISPHVVYGKLMDPKAVPERALKLCNYRKFAGRGFTVFLGLNKSAKELGINDHCYLIYTSSDTVKVYNEMKVLKHAAGQATVCLNNVVPDASPKGTAILYMTTLFTDDCWSKVKEEDYYKLKNEVANGLIKQFEKATGINIHDHIEEIAVATPETYARYCGHPQGVIYGYESQYNDGLMSRIMMVNEDAVVPGLRIGGGWGERLDGFSSAYKSGYNEAARTIRDIEKEKEVEVCLVKTKIQKKI